MPATLPQRRLGRAGPTVSCLGLGCMGMSFAYGPADDRESLQVLHRYVERGGTFLDTAEMYGPYENEKLIGRFLKELKGSRPTIATKFGFKISKADPAGTVGVDSSPANVKKVADESLARLGVDAIDLYYQHRVDPNVPIEETVGAMADLVQAGKVKHLGLSEAGPETIRRAHATHPIAAVQTEYSLWSRDVETSGVLATCRQLGIGFVPYSPLGRGFLTGAIKTPDDLSPDDRRRTHPRFGQNALDQNLRLVDHVHTLAETKHCTPAQLALAWVLAQGEDVVPIPGTKRCKYLDDNLGAVAVSLTGEDLAEIDRLFPPDAAAGQRYPEGGMKMVNR